MDLRAELIRVAHQHPETRQHLVPLIRQAAKAPEKWVSKHGLTLKVDPKFQTYVDKALTKVQKAMGTNFKRVIDKMNRTKDPIKERYDLRGTFNDVLGVDPKLFAAFLGSKKYVDDDAEWEAYEGKLNKLFD